MFLQCLYKDILTATAIPPKPEMLIQGIQVKPEAPKTWLPLCSSLHSYSKLFYKFVTYYMIDHNYNIDIWNIRKQVVGYIMSLKRKRVAKLNAKGCTESRYNCIFSNVLESSSDLLQSNTHKGCCVLNATKYNYKLRSVIGREDDFKVTKWTWFNKQVCSTFLCSWMISRKLVDHTNIGRAIERILNMVYAPSVSMRDSIGSTTLFFHTSMVVHPGSDEHLHLRKFIHKGLVSSLSKKQQDGEVSLNNVALGFDYKLLINILMKQLYIAVQYFYIINRIYLEEDYQAIYTPTVTTKSDYLNKTIDGELIDNNKLEMNKMNSTKSIVSKRGDCKY